MTNLDELRKAVEQEINAVAVGADRETMPENIGILIPSIDLQRSIDRIMGTFNSTLKTYTEEILEGLGEMEKIPKEFEPSSLVHYSILEARNQLRTEIRKSIEAVSQKRDL